MSGSNSGHLYMQTNEIQNAVVHYRQRPPMVRSQKWSGSPPAVQVPAFLSQLAVRRARPTPSKAQGSIIIIARSTAFCLRRTAVTIRSQALAVAGDGKLKLLDRQGDWKSRSKGKSGTAKSLAFAGPRRACLYVLHSFGPRPRPFDVGRRRRQAHARRGDTPSTPTIRPNRVSTMALFSPNGKFLPVGTTFDEADRSPQACIQTGRPFFGSTGQAVHSSSIASNAPDPDGLVDISRARGWFPRLRQAL